MLLVVSLVSSSPAFRDARAGAAIQAHSLFRHPGSCVQYRPGGVL